MPPTANLARVDNPSKQPGRQFAYDDWKEEGLCHDHPTITTDDFYIETLKGRPSNETRKDRAAHIQMLRNLCASCPVLQNCTELGRYELWGFLAGMTEEERATARNYRHKTRADSGQFT